MAGLLSKETPEELALRLAKEKEASRSVGLLSSNPEMREKQTLGILQQQGEAAGGPSVEERLKANKPNRNPFAMKNFGANNPDMKLIKDPDSKAAMQRSAMFRGLGDAGAALMANADQGGAKAFSAGMGAFQKGADADIARGVLVNDKRKAQVAEAARQEGLDEMENDPKNTRAANQAIKMGRLIGGSEGNQIIASFYENQELFGKIDTSKATPASQRLFKDSQDEGAPDYGLLIYPDKVMRSAGENISAMKAFEAQIAPLLDFTFTVDDQDNVHITGMKENATTDLTQIQAEELFRMMSEEAWTRWHTNASPEGSAVNDAARAYQTRVEDPDNKGEFIYKWQMPKNRFKDKANPLINTPKGTNTVNVNELDKVKNKILSNPYKG